jgi:hypothetical protein
VLIVGVDVITMIERMAETGTAPTDGCTLFGVGYEDAFERLKRKYLLTRFDRGGSAEKFVVGPYGSGKTHFLRQLMEMAREMDCVTAEVILNKDLEFTKSLIVYREVAKGIRAPGSWTTGIRTLLIASLDQIRQQANANEAVAAQLVERWVAALDQVGFELEAFGRIAKMGLLAHLQGDGDTFEATCRWLDGEVSDRLLSKRLEVSPVGRAEENLHGRRALLSLFQFVKHARFHGTVLTFDEAEQGLAVDRRRMERILSMLQSGINAVSDLERGSALVIYAFTPDLVDQMERFAALQQRVADPGPGFGFFDGNTLAPRIDLTKRSDPTKELKAIGRRLVDLLFDHVDELPTHTKQEVVAVVDDLAEEIAAEDLSSSNRRMMVKRTCAMLSRLHDGDVLDSRPMPDLISEGEV